MRHFYNAGLRGKCFLGLRGFLLQYLEWPLERYCNPKRPSGIQFL